MSEFTETATEATESTPTSGSTRVSMESFVEIWEEVANGPSPENRTRVEEVADRLGLQVASVQQRATKYRNPATKRVILGEDKKPVKVEGKVQYIEIPEGDRAIAIPLTKMPRGGGAKLDHQAGANLVASLAAKRAEASASK